MSGSLRRRVLLALAAAAVLLWLAPASDAPAASEPGLGASAYGVTSVLDQDEPSDPEFLAYLPGAYKPSKPIPEPQGMIYGGENVPAQGDPNAPITIWMFSDYMCPHCSKLSRQTIPGVRAGYVYSGKANMTFVDFHITTHGMLSLVSHEAAHCAREQGRYFDMHDKIFQHQDDLYYGVYPREDPLACRAALTNLAVDIGLDGEAMRSCLDSERHRPLIYRLFGLALSIDDVPGTPTMVIESARGKRKLVGFYSYLEMEDILDRELARLQATPAPPAVPALPRILPEIAAP